MYFILLLTFTALAAADPTWNPFASTFSFDKTGSSLPQGFGTFPNFNFNSNRAAPQSAPGGGSGNSPFGDFGNFGSFPDFGKGFSSNFGNFDFSSFGNNNAAQPQQQTTALPVVPPAVVVVQATPSPVQQTTTTQAAVIPVRPQVASSTLPPTVSGTNAPFVVTNRNCSSEGTFFGIAPSPTDPCGSVECACFRGLYLCYSTCNPPPANQTCATTIPSGAGNVCPTYSDCVPYADPKAGDAQMFKCNGPVHPSVCWLYEILFGKLTEPVGFFDAVEEGCPLTSQCVCSNGFVQAAQLKPEDFKTPAKNTVYPRAQQGNRGAIAPIRA
jgi:hypothetical protein